MQVSEKSGHVYLEGNELVLEDFREGDPDVVRVVSEADDLDVAVHRCLAVGARALKGAAAALDTEIVERRFSEMTSELDRRILDFSDRMDQSAKTLFDDEQGELATALRTWLEDLNQHLDDTFDENSKRSAIAKLEHVLGQAREEQVHAVRRLLDPDQDDSPLRRWRAEIVREVRDQSAVLLNDLRDLREQLAVKGAREEERKRTTLKGRDFEHLVMTELADIVQVHEDVPELVGDRTGNDGTKVGDIVVAVNPAFTPGRSIRYVIEAKDRSISLRRALDELSGAMRNRSAQAGFMVFAGQDVCPISEPFEWFDHKAVVVFDKTQLNPHALRLACLWARWTACRESDGVPKTVDLGRIHALLDSARLSLRTASAVRGSHTKAKTAIDQASGQLDGLVSQLKLTLDELEDEVQLAGGLGGAK